MANIISNWQRGFACGCSHGHLADSDAMRTVLEFIKDYRPTRRVHLGDFTDQAAFRGGAHGTRDEAISIRPDLVAGLDFLEQLEITDLLLGNHEIRLYRNMHHHNAILAQAAGSVVEEIRKLVKTLHVENFVEHYDINRSWLEVGNYKLMHGWMYNENGIRDHAEHFGNSIIAHLHTAGVAAGRRADHPYCYCVGTLANIPAMDYANTRRSTARWSHGFVYWETNGKETHVNLCQAPPNQAGSWRLPQLLPLMP